jgi:hypothetical protein
MPSASVFLTWSPKWYLVRSTEHKAACYIVFPTPLLPSWVQISSAPYSRKPSAYIPPTVWATKVSVPYKTGILVPNILLSGYIWGIIWVVFKHHSKYFTVLSPRPQVEDDETASRYWWYITQNPPWLNPVKGTLVAWPVTPAVVTRPCSVTTVVPSRVTD